LLRLKETEVEETMDIGRIIGVAIEGMKSENGKRQGEVWNSRRRRNDRVEKNAV